MEKSPCEVQEETNPDVLALFYKTLKKSGISVNSFRKTIVIKLSRSKTQFLNKIEHDKSSITLDILLSSDNPMGARASTIYKERLSITLSNHNQ